MLEEPLRNRKRERIRRLEEYSAQDRRESRTRLAESIVERHHDIEPSDEAEGRDIGCSGADGLGNQLLDDDVEHGPGGCGHALWKKRRRGEHERGTKDPGRRFDDRRELSPEERATPRHTAVSQRKGYRQSFRNIFAARCRWRAPLLGCLRNDDCLQVRNNSPWSDFSVACECVGSPMHGSLHRSIDGKTCRLLSKRAHGNDSATSCCHLDKRRKFRKDARSSQGVRLWI